MLQLNKPRSILLVPTILMGTVLVSMCLTAEFDIVYQNAAEGFEGLNAVTYVTCGVKNVGNSAGNALIKAEFRGGGIGYEQKTQTVYLRPGESNSIKFTFDTSVLGALSSGGGTYLCSVSSI